MTYTIATVDDNTPEYLEFGDYRGLVVLDDKGVFVAEATDLDHAKQLAADDLKVDAEQIDIRRGPNDAPYDGYGPCWDVNVDES